MEVRALFPLVPASKMDSEHSIKQYHAFCQDYSQTKTIKIKGSFTHNGETLQVRTIACSPVQFKKYFPTRRFFRKGDAILEFSGQFKFPGTKKYFATHPDGSKTNHSTAELKAIWQQFLPDDLDLTIQTYFLALSIAYCGAVQPFQNVWIVGRKRSARARHYVSLIHDSVEFLRENNAFANIDVNVDHLIKWVFGQNGMFDGNSDTPASRSLNYFTRLFDNQFRNEELSDLVWALAGVEAILVEGGRSSVGQLREKLKAVLEKKVDVTWLTRMVNDSYDYRSRMIHGNRQIHSMFRSDEDEADKRFYEEYNSIRFVVGVLVILLRYLSSTNLTEIRFKTVVDQSMSE